MPMSVLDAALSRFDIRLCLSHPGIVGVRRGPNEWRTAIVTVGFIPFDISMGFDTHDLSLNVDSLRQ